MKIQLPEQIKSERLILKKHTLEKEYIQLLVDSINQNRNWLGKFLPHFDTPITFEKEEAFIKMLLSEENEINYGIWNKETSELMGTIGIFNPDDKNAPKNVELAIMLFEKFSGKHYGPEAIELLEKELFQKGIKSVLLKIQEDNSYSRKASEKQGYVLENKGTKANDTLSKKQMLLYKKILALGRK